MPISTSRSNTPETTWSLVYGPPDRSKTFSSITLSAKCPADFSHIRPKTAVKRQPAVLLDDLLWVTVDKGALAGMEQQGLVVDRVDMSGISTGTDFPKEFEEAKKLIAEKSKGRKAIIVDTVTSLHEKMTHFSRNIKGLEKFDMHDDVLNFQRKFTQHLAGLPCDVCFLFHAKSMMELTGTSDAVVNANRARKAAGLSSIVPDLTGKALNHYRGECGLIFHVIKKKEADGGEGFYFLTKDFELETKSRYVLPREVPADWRVVRKLLA